VLQDDHAAHDAFQATFLALARKAGWLWARDSLAPWLHQVAYRAACHDRAARFRRRTHERAAAAVRPELTVPRDYDNMLENVIHEEIDRLPRCYRVAVVLCDLEGRTHEQAARHLGCAVGTVKSRLARGDRNCAGDSSAGASRPRPQLRPATRRAPRDRQCRRRWRSRQWFTQQRPERFPHRSEPLPKESYYPCA
jgi:RNA polymerase sigma factor (sigma-70 family)